MALSPLRACQEHPEPAGEMTRYYVAAKVGITAEIARRWNEPPHNRARHIKTDMWHATYPFAGDLYVFRGVRGNLIKILWHDGLGMSLYAKRLEKGRFIWPSPSDGVLAISASQLAYMLDGIDWRNPVHTFRPERAG
jgi:hypothetical protein